MPALKDLTPAGLLKDIHDNFQTLEPLVSGDGDGLGVLRVARATFDLGVAGNRTAEAHASDVELPANAIVVGGVMEVNTAVTGESNATLAVSILNANDIQTAAAVAGAPWSTTGRKAIVPKANTPESTGIKLTAAKKITFTVGTAALLTGKVTVYLYFIEGAVTA
jgi:hypothetical protein